MIPFQVVDLPTWLHAAPRPRSATGGVGLSDIVTSGSSGSWPVYAVRVVPMLAMPGTGVSHALRLEMPGIRASAALPLVQTGVDTWDLDLVRDAYELHGTVSRTSTNLTLALSSGSVSTATGPLTLQSASVTLSQVPTNQQGGGQ